MSRVWPMDLRIMTTRVAACFGVVAGLVSVAAYAATQKDYQSALAAAEQAEQRAGALGNQWSTTESDLAAARKAAASKKYDEATELAKRAQSQAELSIGQAQQQDKLWRNEVVR